MANPFPDISPDGPDGWQPDLGQDDVGEELDTSPNGIVQINVFDAAELFHAVGSWKLLGSADLATIRAHYKANKNSDNGFSLFDFFSLVHTAIACGTGDGSTKTFTIPAKATSSQVIYDNGVVVSSGYTILVGTGSDGEDQISFTTAPLAGHAITCDLTGRKRYTVIYLSRKWSPRWVEGDIWALTLEFQERLAG